MIATAVVTSVFGVLQTLISTTVGQRVMHDLRTAVYAQLQRMPLAFFTRTRTGEVQSRIANDIGGMQATVTSTATSLVSNLTAVVASVVAMLALDWRLTFVSLLLLPVFVWISRRVGRERKKITTQRQKQMAAMAAEVTESLSVSGILLGRTMGRSDSLTKYFAAESERLVDLEVRSNMAGRWRMSTIGIVMAAMPAVIYWAAGLALETGGPAVSIGTLVAFVSLQQGLFRPAVSLLSTGVQMQTSLALFQRIFEYLDLPVDITEPDEPGPPGPRRAATVRFEDVDFRYDEQQQRPTLRGIDLAVPAGGSLAVVGPTGSGKSTLSYLVPRLYDVTGGRVTLDGVDVRDLDFDSLARAVGVVSQETYLFHASVAENLRFAKPDATDEELEAAARAAQIHDHIASPARRLRHPRRRARLPVLRRREAAPGHRPHDPARPAGPHPRRGDQRARHPYRTRGPAGHRRALRGPHHHHHRPPALHRARRRPDRRPRRRPDRRARHPRGTARPGRPIRGAGAQGRRAGPAQAEPVSSHTATPPLPWDGDDGAGRDASDEPAEEVETPASRRDEVHDGAFSWRGASGDAAWDCATRSQTVACALKHPSPQGS